MQAPSYSLIASISSARLSMSRWLVGSSRISSCGPSKVASPISSRAFSPPDSAAILVSARVAGKADLRDARADLGFGRAAHALGDMRCRACPASRDRRPDAGRRSRRRACWRAPSCRPSATSRPPTSLAKVDLPLPLAPSSPMRSSLESVRSSLREHDAIAVADADLLHRDDRRAERLARSAASLNGRTVSSTTAAIGSILASIFRRDWACVALVALARKRSTKACRCLRRSSCFLSALPCSACCSRRWRSKLV